MPESIYINGAGRIGRLITKIVLSDTDNNINTVFVNDPYGMSVNDFLYYLTYDTNYGRLADLRQESIYVTPTPSDNIHEYTINISSTNKYIYYTNYDPIPNSESILNFWTSTAGVDNNRPLIDCCGTLKYSDTYLENQFKTILHVGLDRIPDISDNGFASIIYDNTSSSDINSWYYTYGIRDYDIPSLKTQNIAFIYRALKSLSIEAIDVKHLLQYNNLQHPKDDYYVRCSNFPEMGRGIDNIIDTTFPYASAKLAGNRAAAIIGEGSSLTGLMNVSNVYLPLSYGGMTIFSAITKSTGLTVDSINSMLKNNSTHTVQYSEEGLVSRDIFLTDYHYKIISPVCTYGAYMTSVINQSDVNIVNITSLYDPEYGLALQAYNASIQVYNVVTA